jgi:hypothetical protein
MSPRTTRVRTDLGSHVGLSADADQPPDRLRNLLIDYLTPVYIADRLLTDGRTGRSALGTPPISIPMPVVEALPLGLQLTAVAGDDARLLSDCSVGV